MARRGNGRRRNWSQIVFWGLSLAVVLTMVLGSVVGILSQSSARRTPTPSSGDISPPPTPIPAQTATPTAVAAAPSPAPAPEPTPTPLPTPLALSLGERFSFAVCGDSRDGTGYRDVTDSTNPEVLASKKRFQEILADKPLPIVTD